MRSRSRLSSAAVAAVLSPPGRAVLGHFREVVGVEQARPALFSLPSNRRLLVASNAGVWVVQHDGSKRLSAHVAAGPRSRSAASSSRPARTASQRWSPAETSTGRSPRGIGAPRSEQKRGGSEDGVLRPSAASRSSRVTVRAIKSICRAPQSGGFRCRRRPGAAHAHPRRARRRLERRGLTPLDVRAGPGRQELEWSSDQARPRRLARRRACSGWPPRTRRRHDTWSGRGVSTGRVERP